MSPGFSGVKELDVELTVSARREKYWTLRSVAWPSVRNEPALSAQHSRTRFHRKSVFSLANRLIPAGNLSNSMWVVAPGISIARMCLVQRMSPSPGRALVMRIDLLRNAVAYAGAARGGAGRALAFSVLVIASVDHGCATTVVSPPSLPQATADFRLRLEKYVKDTQPLRESAIKKIPDGKTPEDQAKVLERRRGMLAMSVRALRDRKR